MSQLYVTYFALASFRGYDNWYALRYRATTDGVFKAILAYMRALAYEGKAQWKHDEKWWLVNDEAVEELVEQIDGLEELWLSMRGDYEGRMRAKRAEEERQEAERQRAEQEFYERMRGWYGGYQRQRATASTSLSYKEACKVLGVLENASQEDIKRAWRRMSFKHHPDRGGDEAMIKKVNNAYETLVPRKEMSYE